MSGPAADFESVLSAAQAGADWAFSALYRSLNPRLLRYFAARAPAAADDMASETWMGVARGIAGFIGGEEQFRGWVFTIAHRRLVQRWRDAKKKARADAAEAAATDPIHYVGPEHLVVDRHAALDAAAQLIAALSPDQAEVVLLRVLGGLGVDQVAAVMGKRPGAVRVAQHKALRKLAASNISFQEVTQ